MWILIMNMCNLKEQNLIVLEQNMIKIQEEF